MSDVKQLKMLFTYNFHDKIKYSNWDRLSLNLSNSRSENVITQIIIIQIDHGNPVEEVTGEVLLLSWTKNTFIIILLIFHGVASMVFSYR